MRGKLPMSAKQRKINSTPVKNLKHVRLAPPGDAPRAPDCLTKRAFEIWDELVPLYEAKGLLVRLDSDMLGLYCQTRADREEALETIVEEGRYYVTTGGLRRLHPAVGVAGRAAVLMARLASELALLPRGRAVVNAERKPVDPPARMPDVKPTALTETWCSQRNRPECEHGDNCWECEYYHDIKGDLKEWREERCHSMLD